MENTLNITAPTLKEFTKFRPTYYGEIEQLAYDIATTIVDWYKNDEAHTKVINVLKELFENDETTTFKNWFTKYQQHNGIGQITLPIGIAKKVYKAVKDIDGIEDWVNEFEFHISPAGKDLEKEYKTYVDDVKEFIATINHYRSNKIYVENPNWQGITGATQRDRTQHFHEKSAPIVKELKEILIDGFLNHREENLKFIKNNSNLNVPETDKLLSWVAYFRSFKFYEYVVGKTFKKDQYGF